MNEDELRDALHAEVEDVDVSADAFDRLQQRLGVRHRSAERSWLLAGVAVVLVVALVGGAVALIRGPSPRRTSAGPARRRCPGDWPR